MALGGGASYYVSQFVANVCCLKLRASSLKQPLSAIFYIHFYLSTSSLLAVAIIACSM